MEFITSAEFPQIPSPQDTNEWKYTFRRTMQEIVPGLYLGPYSVATKSKLHVLLNNGITHVICVRQEIESHIIKPHFEDSLKYLVLNIADTTTENIIKHFPAVCIFIEEAISSGGKCLVHGNAGISRSAALVMAYVMQRYGLSSRDAFVVVQQRRFCINPNEGFMAQLTEFEPIYRAQQTRYNGQCSTEDNRNKRRIDDLDEATSEELISHSPKNGKMIKKSLDELLTTNNKDSCFFHVDNYNTIQLTNCNYIVEKVIKNSRSPTTVEAMDQEISG